MGLPVAKIGISALIAIQLSAAPASALGDNEKAALAAAALLGIAALSLLGTSAIPMLLVAFVLFQGSGYGVTSIVRPVVTAEFLGRTNFGVISGLLALPFITATAAAPTIAAFVWERGGYDRVILLALSAAGIGLVTLLSAAFLSAKTLRA